MRRGIFSQLFNFFFSAIAAAIIIVGTTHIYVSLAAYYDDWKREISSYTEDAVRYAQTRFAMYGIDEIDSISASVEDYFTILADRRSGSHYLLTDSDGIIIAHSGFHDRDRSDTASVSVRVIDEFGGSGKFTIGNLGKYFDKSMINVMYIIDCDYGEYYIFGSLDTENMRIYVTKLLLTFTAVSVLVLLLSFPLINFSVMRIVRPISEMSQAARRFGEGDFSQKVSIYEQNELGYLANSMNEMAESLASIDDERKSFVSNVSHELKTPMTTIGGFVDGILDGTIPREKERHYLRIVSEEIDRLARLVRSMLNLSKYESGEVGLQTENFNVTELIVRTVFLFEKRLEDKHIDIQGLDLDSIYLNADVDLTQQVIYNLTENAVKFVNENGVISYSVNIGEDGMTAICIRNTGEGLKENEISRVFDKFYKTDESRGKDKTGVGLGLSIVRSIIKLHGGTVLVRSVYGEYTEFEFTMPSGTIPLKHG